jgi:hypothetical protein
MLEIVVLGILGGLVALLTARLVRRRRAHKPGAKARGRSPLEHWIDDQVTQEIAKKLTLERDVVSKSLRGDPDPDTVVSLEQGVRSVQLAYERLAHAKEAEVRIELSYEDGTLSTIRKRIHWDEAPQAVRDELDRTGASQVFRSWHFPWSDPSA